jgi:hypothetical protein
MATAEIMDVLATKTPDELREIAARTAYLLDPTARQTAAPAAAPRKVVGEEDPILKLLWQHLEPVLRRATGEDVPPLRVILGKRVMGAALRDSAVVIQRLLKEAFKAKQPAEKNKVMRLIVGLTAQDLAERGKLHPIRLCQRLRYAERTLDRHFPGYRESNLLPMVLHGVKA